MNWFWATSASLVGVGLGLLMLLSLNLLNYLQHLRKAPDSTVSARFIPFLLKLSLPSDEEQENIIGDLLEEFDQFTSKEKAYLWLSKQVIKSICPLIYKILKTRIASLFRERIR
jgi:hypothetical protein